MSLIGMAEDVKLVDSFLLAIGKTDRGGDVERNVVLDFIRHIRAAQKKEQGESPVNNTQQLKAEIRSVVTILEDEGFENEFAIMETIVAKLRELSAV